tara:strand:- start:325 stop:909 length:585 start_codon:yes stop_codon:yes gene_type:complete
MDEPQFNENVVSKLMSEYGKISIQSYYLLPITAILASIFLLCANPSWRVLFFLVGLLTNEGINITGNVIIKLKDIEPNELNPFANRKMSHTIQAYAYILGFFTTRFVSQKKYFSIFAAVTISILLFIIEIIVSPPENTWSIPLYVFAYGIGLFIGMLSSYAAAQVEKEDEVKPKKSVCKAYQNGIPIGKLTPNV